MSRYGTSSGESTTNHTGILNREISPPVSPGRVSRFVRDGRVDAFASLGRDERGVPPQQRHEYRGGERFEGLDGRFGRLGVEVVQYQQGGAPAVVVAAAARGRRGEPVDEEGPVSGGVPEHPGGD